MRRGRLFRATVMGMTEPNRDRESAGSQDIIDDALRLVDALQRKLLAAGVRRGVAAVTSAPPKGDVWEEAVSERPGHGASCEYCPICRLMDAMRGSGVDASEYLDRAAASLKTAAEDVWAAYEQSRGQDRSGDSQKSG